MLCVGHSGYDHNVLPSRDDPQLLLLRIYKQRINELERTNREAIRAIEYYQECEKIHQEREMNHKVEILQIMSQCLGKQLEFQSNVEEFAGNYTPDCIYCDEKLFPICSCCAEKRAK
jgi:outer membrane protein assembly factor BamD (BamD/ComL family)